LKILANSETEDSDILRQVAKTLIEKLLTQHPGYKHRHIGFKEIILAMVGENKKLFIESIDFQERVKEELHMIMHFLDLVENKNLVGALKLSILPLLLQNYGGNETKVKLVIFAIYLSTKDLPSITETLHEISNKGINQTIESVHDHYQKFIKELRHLRVTKNKLKGFSAHKQNKLEDTLIRNPMTKNDLIEKAKMQTIEHDRKNELRAKLGLEILNREPDDPYRPFPIYKKIKGKHELQNQQELWEHDPLKYLEEIKALPDLPDPH
jgi:hypothetical protein